MLIQALDEENILRIARYAIRKMWATGSLSKAIYTNHNILKVPLVNDDTSIYLLPSVELTFRTIELRNFWRIGRPHKSGKRLHFSINVAAFDEFIVINKSNLIAEYRFDTLTRGTQILYVPNHAYGPDHADVEAGFVWNKHPTREAYWCRFWNRDRTRLRTIANSELVNTANIVVRDTVSSEKVAEAIRLIEYGRD